MAKKFPLRIWLTKKATTTSHTLKTEPVKEGWEWRIERFGVEDETTAFTEWRAYIEGRGYKHLLTEQDSPSAATLYWDTDDFSLFEGERLAIDFSGVTVGDELRVYILGYKQELS